MIREIGERDLVKFRYFLECYFNMSYNYSELDSLIDEYRECENEEYVIGIKKEIEIMLLVNDLEFIKGFIKKYGMRNMENEKIIWLINEINNKIQ